MSRFPDALRSALATEGWSQSELARRSKAVTPSTVGRYLAGMDLPKPDTLDQLVGPFKPRLREELTAAYLTEHIPASVRERVTVNIRQEGQEETVAANPEQPLPGSHLERILRALGREALGNVNLFHILDSLAAPLEGRLPLLHEERDDLVVLSVQEQSARLDSARLKMEEAKREVLEGALKESTGQRRVRYAAKPTPPKGA